MSIRTATVIVIVGLAIALLMSLGSPFMLAWLFERSEMTRESAANVQKIYFGVSAVLHYGSLLAFFIALYNRQKGQTS